MGDAPSEQPPQPEAKPPQAQGFATARWGWETSRPQFEAMPPTAPGFESSRTAPGDMAASLSFLTSFPDDFRKAAEPSAAGAKVEARGIIFHPLTKATEDPLPDSWAGAAAAMELAKAGGRSASAGVSLLATSMAGKIEDLGEPLKDLHPKEFVPPKEYSGGADTWMSWSDSFKDHLNIKDPRWKNLQNLA